MMSEPMFSIIIPAYNAEEHIRKGLESIASQTYTNYELIVVCDSCTDNTEQIAHEYGAKTLRVQYGTDGLTRDAGVRIATGEWVMFMDDDDWWLHDHVLEQLSKVVGQHDEDIFAFAFIHKAYGYIKQQYEKLNDDSCVNVWSKCFRRSIIKDAKFGNTKYYSDRFFLRRVYQNASKIVFWDMPMYYYNWNRPGSQTHKLIKGLLRCDVTPIALYNYGEGEISDE